ncbi:hypothetical protein [Shewanella surugensis]|uniref:Uncharacterized protein n=1 Tax=Shewanella surugensis TaxID=212020 RepID=A0ABT0L9I3_9GAMM|nr:hypothetical protein [Shewanella surugensis]MCL1124140.1 hypothetical protein [Shewanella surugensis]
MVASRYVYFRCLGFMGMFSVLFGCANNMTQLTPISEPYVLFKVYDISDSSKNKVLTSFLNDKNVRFTYGSVRNDRVKILVERQFKTRESMTAYLYSEAWRLPDHVRHPDKEKGKEPVFTESFLAPPHKFAFKEVIENKDFFSKSEQGLPTSIIVYKFRDKHQLNTAVDYFSKHITQVDLYQYQLSSSSYLAKNEAALEVLLAVKFKSAEKQLEWLKMKRGVLPPDFHQGLYCPHLPKITL